MNTNTLERFLGDLRHADHIPQGFVSLSPRSPGSDELPYIGGAGMKPAAIGGMVAGAVGAIVTQVIGNNSNKNNNNKQNTRRLPDESDAWFLTTLRAGPPEAQPAWLGSETDEPTVDELIRFRLGDAAKAG